MPLTRTKIDKHTNAVIFSDFANSQRLAGLENRDFGDE